MVRFLRRRATPESASPASHGGFAVIDLETTGLSPRSCRIVEMAVVLLDSECRVVGEMVSLVNPGQHVGATSIHGIRARDLVDAPSFAQLAPTLLTRLAGRVPVAHNAMFEMRFLAAEFERLGLEFEDNPVMSMCTMQLAPSYLPSVPARNLAACAQAAGIPQYAAHTALDDARVTAQLLAYYRAAHRQLPPSWQEALVRAASYRWPAVPAATCQMITRQEAAFRAATEQPYLARLVAALPRTGGENPQVQSYLALLDRALEDRLVTEEEAAQLEELAHDLGLGADSVLAAHRSYLTALTRAAWDDGVVTDAERADLEEATRLLALDQDDLDVSLLEARERTAADRPSREVEGALHMGDRVVITGDTLLVPRHELEARTVAAGLRVIGAVSGKTKIVVVADPHTQSMKARRARELGIRIVGEAAFLNLLGSVQPAEVVQPTAPAPRRSAREPRAPAAGTDGPLDGRKFLLVGFTDHQRTELVAAVTAAGGAIGVYAKDSLTAVVPASGSEGHELTRRCEALGVPVWTAYYLLARTTGG